MDYQKIYNAIIARSTGRTKLKRDQHGYVYYEKHHIVPKCLGGSNDKENLAYLTAEEHWVAHLLLVKLYPGNNKLIYACQAMSMNGGNTERVTNKMFGWIRRAYANASSVTQKGRIVPEERRAKISATLKGRPALHQQGDNNVSKRPEVAEKISKANTGKKHGPKSEEAKLKISLAKKGKPNLPGELNPAFKGWIIATPLTGGQEIRMSSIAEMKLHGFTPSSVYACVNGRNHKHKGYSFRRIEKN